MDSGGKLFSLVCNARARCSHGCDQLGYAALHKLLGELGVFKLLADGHTPSGAHQFRQI